MKIQESAENYLEAILILKQNKGSVRSIDIAHYLNFSKPSVSIAMKNLRNSDMITVDSDGFISLTEAGSGSDGARRTGGASSGGSSASRPQGSGGNAGDSSGVLASQSSRSASSKGSASLKILKIYERGMLQ